VWWFSIDVLLYPRAIRWHVHIHNHTGHQTLYTLTQHIKPLTLNDDYSCRTAPLTSKRCILYIYSTNTDTEYFKHCTYSSFFPLQSVVFFINLTYLVPVLFTFYIQGVLKSKNNSGAKRLNQICKFRISRLSCRTFEYRKTVNNGRYNIITSTK